MNNNSANLRNKVRKRKHIKIPFPLTIVYDIFSHIEAKLAGLGCLAFVATIALIVYLNTCVLDYLIWFVTGQHLPTWMDVILGIFLIGGSPVIYALGFIAWALQHLNLLHIPLIH